MLERGHSWLVSPLGGPNPVRVLVGCPFLRSAMTTVKENTAIKY